MSLIDNLSSLNPLGEKPKKPPVQEPSPEEIQKQQEAAQAGQKMAEFEALEEQIAKSSPTQAALYQAKKQTDDQKTQDARKKIIEAGIKEEITVPETPEVPVRDQSWVDRAERIIDEDKEQPYKEEVDESSLQKDFLNGQYEEGMDQDDK
jgi:hypothetical protein